MGKTDAELSALYPNFAKLKSSVKRLEGDIIGISESKADADLSGYENMLRRELQVILAEVPGVGADIYKAICDRRRMLQDRAMDDAIEYTKKVLGK